MRVAQVGAFVTTIASLSSLTYGYTFSESNKAIKAESGMTKSLTENQKSSIYGGEAADVSKYPFIASLSDSLSGSTFCAGTLITPQFILTAGHCITIGILPTIATFESNLSSVGEAKVGEQEGVDYKIVAGFRHPLYNKTAHLYDVGLLKLEKPVKRPTAKLCAGDGSDNPVGTMATALGWGKTPDNNATMNSYLEEITLPIITNAECNKFKRYVGRITEGMLCAGVGDGRDTCNGDSGGPLIVNGDTLIGFVSWGSKCGEQAGVFTRLTYVMDYIEGILNGGEGSEYGEVEPGSEMMQSIADAMATGSGSAQALTDTSIPMESGSGSIDIGAMLTELLNAGSSPSDLQKMFSSMGMQLSGSGSESGSEDIDHEKDPEDTDDDEDSFEATLKKADSESEDAVSEEGSESADDEQEALKSGSADVTQSMSDASSADSQDVTETVDASDSGSNDISAMLAELFGGGSNPSDLSKMFSSMGMQLSGSGSESGSEDIDHEKDPEDTDDDEDSFEATLKKADSESEDAVSEEGSESADDEQEALKSGSADVTQSISDASSADSQDVTETIDASDSGSNDISAMLAELFGGGSNPSDLSKMFSSMGMQLSGSGSESGSEDIDHEKDPEDTDDDEDSFEATLKKADSESEDAVSEQDTEAADDGQEAGKLGRQDSLAYLDSGTDEELVVKPRESSKTMESVDEASALQEEETAEQTELVGKSDMQGGAK